MSNTVILDLKSEFAEWVNSYSDRLYSWAVHKTSSKEVAEDLVQETFYAAFKSLDKFERKSNPFTWLSTILNNKIIDYYRSSAKNFIVLDHSESKNAFNISESIFDKNDGWNTIYDENVSIDENKLLDNSEFVNELENCYGKLPPNWKKAIQAKYIFNVDSSQICQELDITPSNYWKVIQRAKLLLKQCLESNWFK